MAPETHDAIEDLDLLRWYVEMGADDAVGDESLNRFEEKDPPLIPKPSRAAVPPPPRAAQALSTPSSPDTIGLAEGCDSLAALRNALAEFEGCALKKGARNLVFADGQPQARVMIVGEAPGRDEDMAGLPFVGQSGQLLDKMFAAIGLSRKSEDPAQALYISNVIPWRPPQNRDPSGDEVAMMLPFLARHIALADPEIIVTMGNSATKALLATTTGITRLRGNWAEYQGRALMPMFHPAALLRRPDHKRAAWADLLAIQERLEAG